MNSVIEIIKNELPKYEGLTRMEKKYGLEHVEEWVSDDGRVDILVKKFAEKSLDIRPFLDRVGLLEKN